MSDTFRPAQVASFLLKCSPLIILALFGGTASSQNHFPLVPYGPYWTLLDLVHMALLVASAGLALAKGCLVLQDVDMRFYWVTPALREVTSDFAMAISLVLILLVLRKRWRRCLPPSGFVAALLGLLLTASVLDVFCRFTTTVNPQDIILATPQLKRESVIVSFVLAAAVAGNFVASELQDLVLKRPTRSRKPINQDLASVLHRLVCVALFP